MFMVMVMVILGGFSAVALPKFVKLGSVARTTFVQPLRGRMASANTLILMKSTLAGTNCAVSYTAAADASNRPDTWPTHLFAEARQCCT